MTKYINPARVTPAGRYHVTGIQPENGVLLTDSQKRVLLEAATTLEAEHLYHAKHDGRGCPGPDVCDLPVADLVRRFRAVIAQIGG